jgi:hypothetical protein
MCFTHCVRPTRARQGKSNRSVTYPSGSFLEELDSGPVQRAIEKLVAARQLFNHLSVIYNWNRLGGEVVGG